MNSQVWFRICVYLCLTGLTVGCAGSARQSNAPAKVQAGDPGPPPRQNDVFHLSSGDTVFVSVEVEPAGFLPALIHRQVSADGTLGLWDTQRVQIAGLTPDEAASTIKLALITNYFGFIFRKVNVIKVQPPAKANQRFRLSIESLVANRLF
jgi:protein involved in polysaccharide export with SLBB domain